MNVETESIFFT